MKVNWGKKMNTVKEINFVSILNDIYEDLYGKERDIVDFEVRENSIVPIHDPSVAAEIVAESKKRLEEIEQRINDNLKSGKYDI